jgi:hypothetical protein
MRILATALAVMALTVLPVQAGASTPNTAPEQTKPEAGAVQLSESQAVSTPSAEPTAADTKKPTEQTATQTDATAEPKPDQSAQTISSEHDASPAAS